MTYVVTDNCIKCKYMDCVEVCPVDCFYEGENMLVIHPDECIDCGVCEPECPAEAILPDGEPHLEKCVNAGAKLHRFPEQNCINNADENGLEHGLFSWASGLGRIVGRRVGVVAA